MLNTLIQKARGENELGWKAIHETNGPTESTILERMAKIKDLVTGIGHVGIDDEDFGEKYGQYQEIDSPYQKKISAGGTTYKLTGYTLSQKYATYKDESNDEMLILMGLDGKISSPFNPSSPYEGSSHEQRKKDDRYNEKVFTKAMGQIGIKG